MIYHHIISLISIILLNAIAITRDTGNTNVAKQWNTGVLTSIMASWAEG